MTDLRVSLESQAFELHQMAVDSGPHSGLTVIYAGLANLIDGMLELHDLCECEDAEWLGPHCREYEVGAHPCRTLDRLATYVSAVTGNTPPEGAA